MRKLTIGRRSVPAPVSETLAGIGYTSETLTAVYGVPPHAMTASAAAVARRRRPDVPVELRTAAALLLLGQRVTAADAARALQDAYGPLREAGVLRESASGDMHADGQLVPFAGGLVSADFDRGRRTSTGDVLGIQPSTLHLANLTPREQVSTAIDLGTGCGALALLLTASCERVACTDLNDRALECCQRTLTLSGAPPGRWTVHRSDWFRDLDDIEAADLIVSNLPFTIAPSMTSSFEHSTRGGDRDARDVLVSAADHLADGGLAYLLASWVVGDEHDWAEPVVELGHRAGCDVIVLLHGLEDALSYAAARNHDLAEADVDEFERELDRWLTAFGAAHIRTIASGAVVLRRRSGSAHWASCHPASPRPGSQAAPVVRAMIDGGDLLAGSPVLHRGKQLLVHPGLSLVRGAGESPVTVSVPDATGVEVALSPLLWTRLRTVPPTGMAVDDVTAQLSGADEAAVRDLVAVGYATVV